MNMVYRAYRVPYEWVPQAKRPKEANVIPPDVSTYRVSGNVKKESGKVTTVEGINPNRKALVGMSDPAENKNASADFCVVRAVKK